MSRRSKRIALALSAIIIFTVGVMWGIHLAQPDQEKHIADSSVRRTTASSSSTESFNERDDKRRDQVTNQVLWTDPAHEEIMRNLRAAMLLPKETRTTPLLKALEETTKVPLTKTLINEMRTIINEGEIESSHFLLSLMEQREEKSSVDLLLHAATHQNPDIADRALFALEAVAGTVFKDHEEATTWAATWKPDPERAKLFAPVQENDEVNTTEPHARVPGPRSQAPKSTE